MDWEPAWHARSPGSLSQCACTGPGGWMGAWWRMLGRRPQSSHTEFEGGSGSQKPNDPTGEETHKRWRNDAYTLQRCSFPFIITCFSKQGSSALFLNWNLLPFLDPRPNPINFCWICEVLTVLMLTLMTGMRERQDDVGSGLSALMFTLHGDQRHLVFQQLNSATFLVSTTHLAVTRKWK